MKRINHKFNIFDECEICGVIKEKRPYIGSGYNFKFINKFDTYYSSDNGNTWSKEFINCKSKSLK